MIKYSTKYVKSEGLCFPSGLPFSPLHTKTNFKQRHPQLINHVIGCDASVMLSAVELIVTEFVVVAAICFLLLRYYAAAMVSTDIR